MALKDRWALAGLAALSFAGGAGLTTLANMQQTATVKPSPVSIVDFKRLDELEFRVRALEDRRSMNLTTGTLQISVYPVEKVKP